MLPTIRHAKAGMLARAGTLGVVMTGLVAVLLVLGGCGGGDGTAPISPILPVVPGPDVSAPAFGGVRSVAIAGGAFVRLDWNAADAETTPPAAITYRVYASAASGTQNFAAPIATTAGGATSIILTAA